MISYRAGGDVAVGHVVAWRGRRRCRRKPSNRRLASASTGGGLQRGTLGAVARQAIERPERSDHLVPHRATIVRAEAIDQAEIGRRFGAAGLYQRPAGAIFNDPVE